MSAQRNVIKTSYYVQSMFWPESGEFNFGKLRKGISRGAEWHKWSVAPSSDHEDMSAQTKLMKTLNIVHVFHWNQILIPATMDATVKRISRGAEWRKFKFCSTFW